MNTTPINKELALLREQINGRASLLQEYTTITNQLTSLPKGKENYDAILALTEKQELLLLKLKENKKLQEIYHQKIEEKGALIKAENPTEAEKLLDLEQIIAEKETVLLSLSPSVRTATKLLNELSNLAQQSGKKKVWFIRRLMGKLINLSKEHAQLPEQKTILSDIRKLARQYKNELAKIRLAEFPALPIPDFRTRVDDFLENPTSRHILDLNAGPSINKLRLFEKDIFQQLEQLEEKEAALEIKLKELKQTKIGWIEKA